MRPLLAAPRASYIIASFLDGEAPETGALHWGTDDLNLNIKNRVLGLGCRVMVDTKNAA